MSESNLQPIEGEVMPEKAKPEAKGVFIGTLNIMTEPGRNFITEPLGALYRSRYHGKYRRPRHVFAFDLGLIAVGVALGAVAIYFGLIWKPFEPIQAQFAATPKNPVAGGEIVLNYSIANRGADPIEDAAVAFKLPAGIKFLRSSLAYQRDKNQVSLGPIDPGSDAVERLVGQLSGSVGQNFKVIATLTYKEGRTGKAVTKVSSASVKIAGSSVGGSFALPEKIIVGQAISGSIDYWNRGKDAAASVVLVPDWPDDFTLLSSDRSLKAGRWELGTLASGSAGKINWTGIVNQAADAAEFGLETGIKSGADVLLQSQETKSAPVIDPGISASIQGDAAAALGQSVDLAVTYRNSGEHAIKGGALKILADDGLAASGETGKSGLDLAPGAEGTWKFRLKVAAALPDSLRNSTNPQLKIRASVEGKLDGEEPIAIQSPAFAIKIASTLSLNAAGRYWSENDDQLGRGPLPPQAGKATRYWIFWNAKSTTGETDGVRVSGRLPDNVSFTGKASVPFGDAPIFDPETRVITWNAGDIPAWTGVSSPAAGVAFEVSLVPTSDQIGTYPLLVADQKISGTDAATGLKLGAAVADITAHLTTDPKAAATGTVR